jgi:hypothetical protein
VQSPFTPLIKHYTQILYIPDKWDIMSIQCKMSLRDLSQEGNSEFRVQSLEFRVTLRLVVYRKAVRLGDKLLETHDQ